MTPDHAIATAADYADAMITARRAKNVFVLLLILMLLGQLAMFFTARYSRVMDSVLQPPVLASLATSQPTIRAQDGLNFLTNSFMFLALVLTIALGFVLLLIVNIMLVGRLIGVARLTGAYIWSLILLFLLFPWQFFLNNTGLSPDLSWKIPGVLYTWGELVRDARFSNTDMPVAVMKWARFLGFPLLAIIILLVIQVKSNRGMRQALGEDELPTTTTETGV